MKNNTEQSEFTYTYSAMEQAELRKIREKYTPSERSVNKMDLIRRLDACVYSKATTAALVIGILGALIMGLGMSLVMTDIGSAMGTTLAMTVGVMTGIVGVALVCLAYPVYNHTLKKEQKRIAPEILRLTDELMK